MNKHKRLLEFTSVILFMRQQELWFYDGFGQCSLVYFHNNYFNPQIQFKLVNQHLQFKNTKQNSNFKKNHLLQTCTKFNLFFIDFYAIQKWKTNF